MRLSLHDAELAGSVAVGGESVLSFRALISAAALAESTLALEVNRSDASLLPAPRISWRPCAVQRGSFAVGGICNSDNPTNCSCLPSVKVGVGVYYQEAYAPGQQLDKPQRGGVATALKVQQPQDGRQVAWLSTANSLFDSSPSNASIDRAVAARNTASTAGLEQLSASHREWWGRFWAQSFVSLQTTRLEAFYYTNTYQFVSSCRHGVHDLTGALGPEGVMW
eukprot:SAG11_NODE_407_length_9712_cov_11.569437_5_plen_223_part_00